MVKKIITKNYNKDDIIGYIDIKDESYKELIHKFTEGLVSIEPSYIKDKDGNIEILEFSFVSKF